LRLAGLIALLSGMDGRLRGGRPEFSPLPEVPLPSSGLWRPFATLRTAGGYRSNPLLGATALGTGFGSVGADLFLIRLPVDNTSFTLLFNAEDIRYFTSIRPVTNEPGGNLEQTFFTDLRTGRGLGSSTNWTLKFEGRHVYNDQFLNTSSFDGLSTNLSSLRAVTHLGTVIPGLAWQGSGPWNVELAAVGTRQVFLDSDPETGLSSTWEIGPRLAVGSTTRLAGTLTLEISGLHREFDDRVQSTSLGLPLADTRLRQDDLRAELSWRRDWGSRRQWQSQTRIFQVWRRENGEGYTDYNRLGAVASVRFEKNSWRVRVSGRWSTYDFPHSFIVFSGVLAVPRERETTSTELRIEYKLGRDTRLYGEYTWDRESSNRAGDNYQAHVGTLGLERDF